MTGSHRKKGPVLASASQHQLVLASLIEVAEFTQFWLYSVYYLMISMWRIFTPHDKASGNTLWIGKKICVYTDAVLGTGEKWTNVYAHFVSFLFEIRKLLSLLRDWPSKILCLSMVFRYDDRKWVKVKYFSSNWLLFGFFPVCSNTEHFSLLSWILWTRSFAVDLQSLGVHQRCPAPTCWVHTGATLPTLKARLQGLLVSNLELGGATSVGWVSM